MKKFLMAIAAIMATVSMNAQNTSANCYRGFADVAYSIGIGDYEFGRFEINTSHGYQFNPYFYLGAGMGFHFMSEYKTKDMDIPLDVRDSKVDIPIFANARVNFTKGKIAPFIDMKAGMFVTNSGGLYLNPSAGVRIAFNEKQAINVSVGYSYEKLGKFETFGRFTSNYSMDYTRYEKEYNTEAITIKAGFEF
jgi:hypothetical protein